MLRGLFGVLVGLALLCAAFSSPASSRGSSSGPSVDVELAFDATGSMGPSLKRAQADGESIVAGLHAIVPDARFSVVEFRDHGNPGGEYQLLQPFTSDPVAVTSAIARLQISRNPSPDNLSVESYNLAFHRSYTDPALGWSPGSRKIVVVIGDAEPYGGASADIAGCRDTHVDPDGFKLATELEGMRKAGRTLVMVREVSGATTTALACYQSIVALAYPGGAARDGNASDLVSPLVAVVGSAVAPIRFGRFVPLVLPGASTKVGLTLTNPNNFPVQVNNIVISTASGLASVTAAPAPVTTSNGVLTWNVVQTLQPGATVAIDLAVTAGQAQKLARIKAAASLQLAAGAAFTSTAEASLYVTRRVDVRANARQRGNSILGRATISLSTGAHSLTRATGPQRQGSFTLRSSGKTLVLRPYAYRLSVDLSHTVAAFSVKVSTSNSGTCPVGTRGSLVVSDPGFAVVKVKPTLRLHLPKGCSPALTAWQSSSISVRPIAK